MRDQLNVYLLAVLFAMGFVLTLDRVKTESRHRPVWDAYARHRDEEVADVIWQDNLWYDVDCPAMTNAMVTWVRELRRDLHVPYDPAWEAIEAAQLRTCDRPLHREVPRPQAPIP